MKNCERIIAATLWPSENEIDIPLGTRWVVLRRSPTSFLELRGSDGLPFDLVLGRPMALEPDDRHKVKARGYRSDALPAIGATQGIRAVLDRAIELECWRDRERPFPGGALRLMLTHAGNTASLVANEANPPSSAYLTEARISTRGLRSWSSHVRAMSGDTIQMLASGHDEDTFADPAEQPFTTVVACAAGIGHVQTLASEVNPVNDTGVQYGLPHVGHVGAVWLLSTYTAGINVRLTIRGTAY